MVRRYLMGALAGLLVGAVGCDEDDLVGTDIQRFQVEVTNVSEARPILKSGAITTPEGASEPGPLNPGDQYALEFTAGHGMRLSFITMFVQSNDLFYAFPPEGVALYDEDRNPLEGNLTGLVFLYDAGTEMNQAPGIGNTQKPAQGVTDIDVGPAENGVISLIPDGSTGPDGFTYPSKADVIEVTLEHLGDTRFRMTVTNVSTATTLATSEGPKPVPLSPMVWAVHNDSITFFELNAPASVGIERVAEDGVVEPLVAALQPLTGRTVPLSPGVFAIHVPPIALFDEGGAASEGIEALAEDGDPVPLVTMLAGIPGVRQVGAFGSAPALPGESFTFEVEAVVGSRLSLATMYVQSNDLFYAFNPAGIPLFDNNARPINGDVTSSLLLWDAGTEVDEEPAVGLNQAPRQLGPDTGTPEDGAIVRVEGTDSGFDYPVVDAVVRVTITPL